ncbi:MAG: hypothetical protein ACD_72C00196G0001, partial [uncultured bacterium]
MRKKIIWLFAILILVGIIWLGYFYYRNLRGVYTALKNPSADIAALVQEDKTPLKLPPGFKLSIFA